jgi:hypothetical protein
MITRKIIGYGIAVGLALALAALSLTGCEQPIDEPEGDGTSPHTHTYSAAYTHDATQHWRECTANDGAKTDIAAHTAGDWIVDQAATETTAGSKHKECTVCGYETETETIPATGEDPCECNGIAEDCDCEDCDCEPCEETPPAAHTVTFDADNGTAVTTQTVTEGNTVNKPADPGKTYTPIGLYAGTPPTAYTFVEWQKPDGTAWNFTDTVTANITLTAQWTVPTLIDLTDETGNNIVEKTVSYVNANGGSEYTLVLGEDVSDVAPQTLDQDDTTLTITSDGNTERIISLGSNDESLFTVGGLWYSDRSSTLVIDGSITLEGLEGWKDNNNSVVSVVYGGNLMLKGNAKITGNKNTNPNITGVVFGVYVISGTFTMESGEISDNGGIGVFVSRGTFTMEGGEISGNNGTGVHIISNGTFTMKTGAKITGNTANDNPGGVSLDLSSIFIMEGGEISNNTNLNATGSIAGGVHVGGSTFTMQGGVIFGNVCSDNNIYNNYSHGAGVHIRNSNYDGDPATFTKTGGTIYGYTDGDDMSNIVKDGNGSPKTGKGHAVYVNDTYFRDTTVGPDDSISIVSYGDGTTESATGQWTD